ncbi:MAG TPA: hypothetical protein VIK13_18500 [Candidatus Limnocylindrales bacterium]
MPTPERVIETIRAECLDGTVILGRRHLDRTLRTCGKGPRVELRLQDPAGVLAGPRAIQRFTIPVSQLRPFVETP